MIAFQKEYKTPDQAATVLKNEQGPPLYMKRSRWLTYKDELLLWNVRLISRTRGLLGLLRIERAPRCQGRLQFLLPAISGRVILVSVGNERSINDY